MINKNGRKISSQHSLFHLYIGIDIDVYIYNKKNDSIK